MIEVSVEMDDEAQKDFEDIKGKFFSEYKTLDKNCKSRVILNFKNSLLIHLQIWELKFLVKKLHNINFSY